MHHGNVIDRGQVFFGVSGRTLQEKITSIFHLRRFKGVLVPRIAVWSELSVEWPRYECKSSFGGVAKSGGTRDRPDSFPDEEHTTHRSMEGKGAGKPTAMIVPFSDTM